MHDFILSTKFLLMLTINLLNQQYSYGRQHPPAEAILTIKLSRGIFSESYKLILNKNGSDAVNDADALPLSEGFVTLAGLADDGTRLAIDERLAGTDARQINLYAKGWAPGDYTLTFYFDTIFRDAYSLTLMDKYRQISKTITAQDTVYNFFMDIDRQGRPGNSRFWLQVEPVKTLSPVLPKDTSDILIYPSPFHNKLCFSTLRPGPALSIKIRDFTGRKLLDIQIDARQEYYELPTSHFTSGLYLIELFDQKTGIRIKSLKMIKQ